MLLPVRVLARLYGFPDDEGPALVTALNDMIDGRDAGARRADAPASRR